MGRRDRGGREAKKPKKDAKKPAVSDILSQPVTVHGDQDVRARRRQPPVRGL